jgi:hypothetical protein
MGKILRKDYFKSKEGMLKTLGWCWSFSILVGFLLISFKSDYEKFGYIYLSKENYRYYGNDAYFTLMGVTIVWVLLLAYTIYITAIAIILLRQGQFDI